MAQLTPYIAPFILCCLIVAAAVQAVKQLVWLRVGKDRPTELRKIWRLSSIAIGAIAGMGIPDLGWYECLGVGCGAGLLSTSAVAYIQKALKGPYA